MLYQQTLLHLHAIENELKRLAMWSATKPAAIALASTAPFACDTLPLEHWLQFIFLPKMHQLISSQQPLPSKIAIAPMAQYVWAQKQETRDLIVVLERLDELLGGK
ncbi:YqcC family protein [Shewanella yunxiaonensis]|uniref:YqcC family protein n=1 Tax=Shewanella yunxiaonensis TaxID=2829809 RepID=A0ABX7YQ54_9GAMM|nr:MULTISPECIES: YqcC family protein [Shewanella]MDF0534481.1 YqcC family protein [Shewanella sp. A32]QUN04893.1 YqcC family protein [Shewanella yunxiaonensis]